MNYSMSDMYPNTPNSQLPTSSQTIAEGEENQFYTDNTVEDNDGMKTTVDKEMILGAIVLFIGVLVTLHFME